MLAAGLVRDNLQAHLALARVGEQPPSSTPTSLPVRTTCKSEPHVESAVALGLALRKWRSASQLPVLLAHRCQAVLASQRTRIAPGWEVLHYA